MIFSTCNVRHGSRQVANFDTRLSPETLAALQLVDLNIKSAFRRASSVIVGTKI